MESHGFLAPGNRPQSRAVSPSSGQPVLGNRPLSDIREITEPSLLDSTRRKGIPNPQPSATPPPGHAEISRTNESKTSRLHPDARPDRRSETRGNTPVDRPESRQAQPAATPQQQRPPSRRSRWSPERSHEDDTTKTSLYSINLRKAPRRSSSKPPHRPSHSLPRMPAVSIFRKGSRRAISNRRKSTSPVKNAVERHSSDNTTKQRVPSTTLIKVDSPTINDILVSPTYHHPRIQVEIQMAAALFVGGSTVEGVARIIVDEASRVRHRKTLTIERLSIDLLGVEEVFGNKRHIFLSLGNELVDHEHPPPSDMVESQQPNATHNQSWLLLPSVSKMPFLLTLPLEVGPPPFKSKNARIRYFLSATLTIKDAGRQLCVRSTQETSILSVYDPERALVSLPSPLTSSDEIVLHRGRDRVKVTAGLHRQVWVNGTTLFADVHIVNNSRKNIRRVEIHLEQIILFYRHAAASTLEMSASQARLFDETERSTICKSVIKNNTQGWAGVPPFSTDLRTCSIDLPRGYATIKCNKYFEVRYLLNVIIPLGRSFSSSKTLMIQLPIILIHMSSLDVPTNSVAQVAAAIEEKRKPASGTGKQKQKANSNTLSSESTGAAVADAAARGSPRRPSRKTSQNLQGRAFSAPRAASLERQRAQHEDLKSLGRALDASPRKYGAARSHVAGPARQGTVKTSTPTVGGEFSYQTPPHHRKGQLGVNEGGEDGGERRLPSGSLDAAALAPAPAVEDKRDPPRSASAMGYYIPSDEAGRERENRRPSGEAKARHSAESNRPRLSDKTEAGPSGGGTVGGVHLMGVPDAPLKKRGTTGSHAMAGQPPWVPERDRWRPHWL